MLWRYAHRSTQRDAASTILAAPILFWNSGKRGTRVYCPRSQMHRGSCLCEQTISRSLICPRSRSLGHGTQPMRVNGERTNSLISWRNEVSPYPRGLLLESTPRLTWARLILTVRRSALSERRSPPVIQKRTPSFNGLLVASAHWFRSFILER